LGVAQTLGFGVKQFVAGLSRVGIGGLTDAGGEPNTTGILVAIVIIMSASTLSALSGVGKGIKWLSNLNMGLSILLLTFFIIFGATFFGLSAFFVGIFDYLVALPDMSFRVWSGDGNADSVATKLEGWQGGWSVFYWAWWIAFAPFVAGTINNVKESVIFAAPDGDKIFAMTDFMLAPISETLSWAMSAMIVVLLMTYLVTTADSAVLIVNTINAAGDEGPKARPHILFWGAALGAVVAALLLVGGIKAIQTAMVIGALPFSLVMVLQCLALIKAIYMDGKREAAGMDTTAQSIDG